MAFCPGLPSVLGAERHQNLVRIPARAPGLVVGALGLSALQVDFLEDEGGRPGRSIIYLEEAAVGEAHGGTAPGEVPALIPSLVPLPAATGPAPVVPCALGMGALRTTTLDLFARYPAQILTLIPALSVLISFQRAIMVNSKKTTPITIATAIEVTSIIGILYLTIHVFGLIGAIGAAISLMLGRLLANGYLFNSCAKVLRTN